MFPAKGHEGEVQEGLLPHTHFCSEKRGLSWRKLHKDKGWALAIHQENPFLMVRLSYARAALPRSSSPRRS